MVQTLAWTAPAPGQPMEPTERDESPGPGEVVVRVAGCGVCHTDLGFHFDGVPTRHGFPLTLGHEISGTVVEVGVEVDGSWLCRHVVVPAVVPCGTCPACRAGHGSICPSQVFPGNDVHGGFASHVRIPARGLCPVPDLTDPAVNPDHLDLASLSVIADAVTTPYQAILRSGLQHDDLAVFVGAGGVGGFGIQIAASRGAAVVAIDPDPERLDLAARHGADLVLRPDQLEFRAIRQAVRDHADRLGVPTWRRRIFETSGTPAGQTTAFGLIEPGGHLSVVGFTPAKIQVRLSNLMAFDASVAGNWGCLPEHYPAAVDLVLRGDVQLRDYVEPRPLSSINRTFDDLRAHRTSRRVVLIPD